MAGQAVPAASASSRSLADKHPIVVKLGGSVIRSAALSTWLDAIAEAHRPVIVVPGGGALADEVRACQRHLGFGDASAHRMALLAMDQLAWAVAGLRQGFEVGSRETELCDAIGRGRVAVWAPYAAIADRTDLDDSWRLTSDSLALWLAGRIGAQGCYLIKSVARAKARLSAEQLARDGVVDPAFPSMLKEAGIACFLLGRGDQQAFSSYLGSSAATAESFGALID
jgi:5-(aminomethyl)-3-furanmethanol phosphate kinase